MLVINLMQSDFIKYTFDAIDYLVLVKKLHIFGVTSSFFAIFGSQITGNVCLLHWTLDDYPFGELQCTPGSVTAYFMFLQLC